MKAWSQNLGHAQMMTTFTSYGHVEEYRQGEIIKGLRTADPVHEEMHNLLSKMTALVKRP